MTTTDYLQATPCSAIASGWGMASPSAVSPSSMWWAVNVDKNSAQLTSHKVRQIIVKVLDQLQHAVREPLRVVITVQQPLERPPQQLHGTSRSTT